MVVMVVVDVWWDVIISWVWFVVFVENGVCVDYVVVYSVDDVV